MKPLPVLIHKKIYKILIIFGIIIPLILIFIFAELDIDINNFFMTIIILFPLFLSLILFPLTGIIRNIFMQLPNETFFKTVGIVSKSNVKAVFSDANNQDEDYGYKDQINKKNKLNYISI